MLPITKGLVLASDTPIPRTGGRGRMWPAIVVALLAVGAFVGAYALATATGKPKATWTAPQPTVRGTAGGAVRVTPAPGAAPIPALKVPVVHHRPAYTPPVYHYTPPVTHYAPPVHHTPPPTQTVANQ